MNFVLLQSREIGLLTRISFPAAVIALCSILLSHGSVANAAEIKVLCGGGIRSVLEELGPRFERASGHKIRIKFGISAQLKKEIEGGESFDIAILTRPVPDELEKQGKITAGTLAEIARIGIGVAVRTGTPRPDISTVDGFKSALLNAKTISHARESQSGIYFAQLLERLGIAEAVKPKTKPSAGGAVTVVGSVAKGEAELAVSAITDILATAGVDLVGPFPPELQDFIVFAAGVGISAKEPNAAKAFINFLISPEAASIIKASGMEPG
jgi:molybdate transport system substrate-binding protein